MPNGNAAFTVLTTAAVALAVIAPSSATNAPVHPVARATPAGRLVPADGGRTVYDTAQKVTWLADGDLAASEKFHVPNINHDGSMDYATAVAWVKAMNKAGYLGHTHWTLPTTPASDASCSSRNVNTFGFNCVHSALGSLYYAGLARHEPDTVVPIPSRTTGPFRNFQPYLYWSATVSANHPNNANGYMSFSFNTGFQGSNVSPNHLYVLPMIPGKLPGSPKGTVYDANAKVTWLADANLAASQTFLLNTIARGAIDRDGSMTHDTALQFVARMNTAHYLNQTKWQLPPTAAADATCSTKKSFGFGCTGSPMGALYYRTLKKSKGTPVVTTPNAGAGPFHNIQPYLYWACEGATSVSPCKGSPAPGFAWSFSFGDGFEGTDVVTNQLYVMVYYPGAPARTPSPRPTARHVPKRR